MIVKRIRKGAPRKRRSLTEIRTILNVLSTYLLNASTDRSLMSDGENALTRYVLDTQVLAAHAVEAGEKVDLHGTRRLHGRALAEFQRQMLAVNLLVPGAMDPAEHYVMSWKSHEHPVLRQIEDAVDVFAEEMGYQDCQIVWATHSNTKNYHLHLLVNRIDLAQQKVVTPGDGWEIDRLHQIAALIEDAQGWECEPNAIYAAHAGQVRERETGKIMRRADGSRADCDTRKLVAPEKGSSPEYAAVAQALRSSETWQDLHNRLAKLDASYRTKGSGAVIAIGNERMKATSFGREFSYKRVTKKLGDYTPDLLRERDPYEDYLAALRAERARVREALNEVLAQLRAKRLAMKKRARAEEKTLATLMAEARRLRCFDLAEAEVKKAFDRARATIAETQLRREAWYKAGCPNPPQVELPALVFTLNASRDQMISKAHGLIRQEYEHGVEYRRTDGGLAISDAGVVLVVDPGDRNAIAVSLALAHQRGDFIPVSGPLAFQKICREIAKTEGYRLQLSSGELLHGPALEAQSTRAEESGADRACGPESSQEAVSASSSATTASLKKMHPTKRATSTPSPSGSSRFGVRRGDVGDGDLSDEVRWAALKGKSGRSGI